jgi:hypothetical protein
MEEQAGFFDAEERRFLFELALLGLTAGCKLEGLLFSMALETLDNREAYSTVARALGHMQFDQLDEADALLSSPEVAQSDLGPYAMGIRSTIAHLRGDRSQVQEMAHSLEQSGADPVIITMARELLKL